MLQSHRDIYIHKIFTTAATRIDFLSSFLSLGLAGTWRKQLVSFSGLKKGEHVLDMCTGTGELAILIAKMVGGEGSVTGVDFCNAMLDIAQKKTEDAHQNITFVLENAKKLSFRDESFDVVTVAFGMRNINDTLPALDEAYRVLRPNGRFYCLELTTPSSRWFRPFYNFYCYSIIPVIGKLITKSSEPYSYLPRSISSFPQPEEFRTIIQQSGFSNVSVHRMTMGVATIYGALKT